MLPNRNEPASSATPHAVIFRGKIFSNRWRIVRGKIDASPIGLTAGNSVANAIRITLMRLTGCIGVGELHFACYKNNKGFANSERLPYSHRPSVAAIPLGDINTQVNVVLLTQFIPETCSDIGQKVRLSQLISSRYNTSETPESDEAEPLG